MLFGSVQPKDTALANAVAPMEALVNRLSYLTPYLVLDLGAGLTALAQKLVASCNLLFVVAEPVANALTHSKMLMNDLIEAGVPKANVQVVVVNRIRSDTQLTMQEMENQLGQTPVVAITPAPELDLHGHPHENTCDRFPSRQPDGTTICQAGCRSA